MKSSPRNLTEALRRLEEAATGREKARANGTAADQLGPDFEALKVAIDDLKPHLNKLKDDVGAAAVEGFENTVRNVRESFDKSQESIKDIQKKVENQVRENPLWAVGIIGLIALFVGYLLGRKD